MAANMIEVNASTFFDKALENYERLEKVVDYHWSKAKNAYIDDHVDDRWGLFGWKSYSSRQNCFDRIAYRSGAGLTKKECLIKLGYLPEGLWNYIQPFERGADVAFKEDMERLKRTGGKCMIKQSLVKYIHEAEDLDGVLEEFEKDLEEE